MPVSRKQTFYFFGSSIAAWTRTAAYQHVGSRMSPSNAQTMPAILLWYIKRIVLTIWMIHPVVIAYNVSFLNVRASHARQGGTLFAKFKTMITHQLLARHQSIFIVSAPRPGFETLFPRPFEVFTRQEYSAGSLAIEATNVSAADSRAEPPIPGCRCHSRYRL